MVASENVAAAEAAGTPGIRFLSKCVRYRLRQNYEEGKKHVGNTVDTRHYPLEVTASDAPFYSDETNEQRGLT